MPMRYWSPDLLARRDEIETFQEAGEFAVEVVENIGHKVAQVCGPITTGGVGSFDGNMLIFRKAIKIMICRGYDVFNQLPLQEVIIRLAKKWHQENSRDSYCWPILNDVYAPLFESGCIETGLFIPGWDESTGSTWERGKLQSLKINIVDIPEELIIFRQNKKAQS